MVAPLSRVPWYTLRGLPPALRACARAAPVMLPENTFLKSAKQGTGTCSSPAQGYTEEQRVAAWAAYSTMHGSSSKHLGAYASAHAPPHTPTYASAFNKPGSSYGYGGIASGTGSIYGPRTSPSGQAALAQAETSSRRGQSGSEYVRPVRVKCTQS